MVGENPLEVTVGADSDGLPGGLVEFLGSFGRSVHFFIVMPSGVVGGHTVDHRFDHVAIGGKRTADCGSLLLVPREGTKI